MFDFLDTRRHQPEMMDAADANAGDLLKSLRYIRTINKLFGYDRLILRHLKRFSARWPAGQTIRLLDVGTGSADIPLRILKWANKRGWKIQVVGIDLHPLIASQAQH